MSVSKRIGEIMLHSLTKETADKNKDFHPQLWFERSKSLRVGEGRNRI